MDVCWIFRSKTPRFFSPKNAVVKARFYESNVDFAEDIHGLQRGEPRGLGKTLLALRW